MNSNCSDFIGLYKFANDVVSLTKTGNTYLEHVTYEL